MTNPREIKSLSTVISLGVLALGFTLLGLLALANPRPDPVANTTILESNFCVLGSFISVVAGAIFLTAGWIYWNRSATIAGSRTHKKQRRAEKETDVFRQPPIAKAPLPEVSILSGRNSLSQNALVPAKPNDNRMISETFR